MEDAVDPHVASTVPGVHDHFHQEKKGRIEDTMVKEESVEIVEIVIAVVLDPPCQAGNETWVVVVVDMVDMVDMVVVVEVVRYRTILNLPAA